MAVELTSDNVSEYVESNVLRLFPGSHLISATEVTEQTYVNWIFRVELDLASGEKKVAYLRQSRDHVKTRPEIPVDPNRVGFEVKILELLNEIVPDTVPMVLSFDAESNIAVLTDVRRGAPLLVNELQAGRAHVASASDFGAKIGTIHAATLSITDEQVRGNAEANADAIEFHLGMRLAPAMKAFPKETENLITKDPSVISCLVLGDLASKNIFVDANQIRFLDLERAWHGDPAFDPAFLFSHYLLELPPEHLDDAVEFIARFMAAYRDALADEVTPPALAALENRIIRYLGVCILYRIDGLYLVVDAKEDKNLWRQRAAALLSATSTDVVDAVRKVVTEVS